MSEETSAMRIAITPKAMKVLKMLCFANDQPDVTDAAEELLTKAIYRELQQALEEAKEEPELMCSLPAEKKSTRPNDFSAIDKLPIASRVKRALANLGVFTLAAFQGPSALSVDDLMSVRGIGRQAVDDLGRVLRRRKIVLRGWPFPPKQRYRKRRAKATCVHCGDKFWPQALTQHARACVRRVNDPAQELQPPA